MFRLRRARGEKVLHQGKRRKRFAVLLVIGGLLAVTVWGGVRLFERAQYAYMSSTQMATLAGAIWFYVDKHGGLPVTIETLEATGMYGAGAYRQPRTGFEKWESHTGPRPFYVPVQDWDRKTPFIVALQTRTPRTGPQRAYLMLADTSVHYASDADLERLLAEDDARRSAASQPALWNSMRWRDIAN